MYEFIIALLLIFFALLLLYALFMNISPETDMFKDLTRWRDTDVFYKYHSAVGCTIITVYIYSKHRNKIREVSGINVTKYPGYSKDYMIQYILDNEQWRIDTELFYDPWAWRIW